MKSIITICTPNDEVLKNFYPGANLYDIINDVEDYLFNGLDVKVVRKDTDIFGTTVITDLTERIMAFID